MDKGTILGIVAIILAVVALGATMSQIGMETTEENVTPSFSPWTLNYMDAGTFTRGKTILANGTTGVTDTAVSIDETALSQIDYITVTCTTNNSAYATATITGSTTFDVAVYDIGGTTYTGTGEAVNWTVIGSR